MQAPPAQARGQHTNGQAMSAKGSTALGSDSSRMRQQHQLHGKWLSGRLQQLAGRREAEQKLGQVRAKKAALEQQREQLVAEKAQLELKCMRKGNGDHTSSTSHTGHDSQSGLQMALSGSAAATGVAAAAVAAKDQQLLQAQAMLTEQRRLQALEDQIDALDAELEYLAGLEGQCVRVLDEAQAAMQELRERSSAMSAVELRPLLAHAVEALVDKGAQEQQLAGKVRCVCMCMRVCSLLRVSGLRVSVSGCQKRPRRLRW